MIRQVQIKAGVVLNTWEGEAPIPVVPDASWTFVEIPSGQDLPAVQSTYDAQTGVFTPPPSSGPRKMLSKADVIGSLPPATWSELNKFHPTALGLHAGGTAYNDPDVFWAMSVFNSAAKDFALNDPRISALLGRFVQKNIMTIQERDTLIATLATVAK
jgi:hypothetical protein